MRKWRKSQIIIINASKSMTDLRNNLPFTIVLKMCLPIVVQKWFIKLTHFIRTQCVVVAFLVGFDESLFPLNHSQIAFRSPEMSLSKSKSIHTLTKFWLWFDQKSWFHFSTSIRFKRSSFSIGVSSTGACRSTGLKFDNLSGGPM